MIDAARIRELLPHRYPILLVDRISDHTPGRHITAHKAVTSNEPWYADAPNDSDLRYPLTLLMESWAQAAGLLAALSISRRSDVMLLGGMSGMTFPASVFPGDLVTHRVRVLRAFDESLLCEGESTVDDQPVFTVRQAVLTLRSAAQIRPITPQEAP
jgi:3-hydroxyacyl-[acyl-carrier-protein] dehydratase